MQRRSGWQGRLVALLVAAMALSVGWVPASALATAPTAAPTPSSPGSGSTVSANPVFSWTAVSGAAKYRVQVSTSSGFGTTVYAVDTYQLKATPPDDLPLGTLYWRVAGLDAANALGPWSPTVTFAKQWTTKPTLTAPANGSTLSFPANPSLFVWQPLAGASTYLIQIDDATDFSTPVVSATTKLTSFTLTNPQAYGAAFFWRVQGISPAGLNSPWSDRWSYQTTWPSVPVLTSPANAVLPAITDVTFVWNPVPGARSYQLQVSPNGDWQNNKTLDVEVLSTRYSPPTTLNNASYFWRVRSRDAASNYGDWSAVWQFSRAWPGRPTLLGALKGVGSDDIQSVSVPTFRWTPVQRAAYYQLQVGTDRNFSPGTFKDCTTNHTEYTPYSGCGLPLVPGTVYYWHVRGIDAPSGTLGLWSNTTDMDLGAFNVIPAGITLTSPGDGATTSAPVLTWTATNGASQYKVTILDSVLATVLTATTYATSYAPLSVLNPVKGPFSWYVQWIDYQGRTSLIPPQATWRTFSMAAPSATVAAPANLAPAAGTFTRMPSMTWDPVTGASYYRVFYVQAMVEHQLGGNIPYPAFTSTAATLAPGSYAWRVRAYNSSNLLIGTSADATFTIAAPGYLGAADYKVQVYTTPDDPVSIPKCILPGTCTQVRDTPTLSWNAYTGASYYLVYLALDPAFTNVVKTYTTQYTRLMPLESLLDNQAGQAYYWFVRPCFSPSLCGRYDSGVFGYASAFQKSSAPIALGAATASGNVIFSWTPFLTTNAALTAPYTPVTQEARQYRVQVSTTPDFNVLIDDKSVDQTTFTPFDRTYPNQTLYWRVQATDGSSNLLTSSVYRTLSKVGVAPTPTLPTSGAVSSGVPYLKWNPVLYAASYEVEIYKDGDTLFSTTNRVIGATTTMAAWAYTQPLPGGIYAWRVRTLDAQGKPGPWSTGRTFVLTGAPLLDVPANSAVQSSNLLRFSWGAVAGGVRYRVQVAPTTDFASPAINQATIMTQWVPPTRLTDGTWYWRVQVLDANSNVLGTSSVRSLRLDSVAPTVTIAPAASPSITQTFTATFSEAVTGISATTFKMVVAGTTTTVGGTVTPTATTSTKTATFKPSTPLIPGESYALTVAGTIKDAAGNAVVAKSITVRVALAVENGSVALRESWPRVVTAAASGGAYVQTRQAGNTETLTVTNPGTVSITGVRGPTGGYADVYLDGVKKTVSPISFYNASTQYKATVFTLSAIPAGTHTVQLRVLGTKPTASTGTWVRLDSFIAGGVTYEENASQVVARFPTVTNASASGGSYDVATRAYGEPGNPGYMLAFKGTGVVVYGSKTSTSGVVNIYVDGVLRASNVSLNAATAAYKQVIWTSPALANARHTISIVVVGATATGSTKINVGIDWLAVK